MQSGARLGPYEVLAKIGAGGMGEVYRARDTRLNRDVALKILPELFAADADRLARFQREAQILASLNHPNIAHIYGLEGQHPGIALVMELVDGPTLADRITGSARRGLGPDEALAIARQIAIALDAAHERGIVHRDLKPANVKVAADGTVKVLDFGLARPGGLGTAGLQDGRDATASPTITSPAVMTGVGVILGTAAYMSPEQARGRPVDKRADIWAFGCVLYEMLTGRRAFTGDDVTETIGAVIHKEPDWSLLGPDTPASVRVVLQRCLAKDPKQRFHDIGDVRLALDGAFDVSGANAPSPAVRARRRLIAAAFAAVSVVAVTAMAVAVWSLTRATPVAPTAMRFTLTAPTEVQLGQFFALSPDGRNLAFFATGVNQQLWIHSLETGETRLLSRAGNVNGAPFWSADSRFVAYGGEGKLKRIDPAGGPAEPICDVQSFAGGSWNQDGVIVFAIANRGLMRVAAAGGTPTPLTRVDPARGETVHTGPWFLPDGRRFLYLRSSKNPESAGIYVGSLDATPEAQSLTRLLPAQQNPQYIRDAGSGAGHLVFMRDGTLMAQPFDPGRIALGGEAVRVADQVGTAGGGVGSYGFFWVSNANALVYRRSESATGAIVWTSRTGQETAAPLAANLDRPLYPKLSPDGRKLAAIVAGDLWVYDLEGRPPIRLTFGGAHYSPLWTPDGRHIAHEVGSVVVTVAADGSAASPEPMSPAEGHFHPHGWSPDGREILLVAMQGAATHSPDIVRYSWREKGDLQNVVATAANEGANGAALSPDAEWLAYVSDETGRLEIWVRPYLHAGPAVRLSANGGVEPVWAKNGRELYYLEQNKMMSVAVSAGAPFNFKPATLLFESKYQHSGQPPSYDVAADGRFLMIKPANTRLSSFNVLLNWSPAVSAASH